MASFPGGTPTAPSVHIFDPPDDLGPVVPIVFLINDPNSDPLDLSFEYQDSAGAYKPGTLAPGSVPLTRMPAPALSTDYRLLWNAGTDLGPGVKQSATVRLTPTKTGAAPGTPPGVVATSTFHVDTTPAPPLPTNQTQPVNAQTVLAVAGDGQVGIAGRFLQNALQVQVLDDHQQPIAGAKVSFWVVPGSGPTPNTGDIEEDPGYGTTTNSSGYAAARVRPGVKVVGPIQIQASVVGAQKIAHVFNATIYAAKIVADVTNPAGPFGYGQTFGLTFFYDGDGNTATTDFQADPGRPVRIKVAATNAELERTVIYLDTTLPTMMSNSFQVTLIPNTRDQEIQLTLTDLDQPTVSLVQKYPVQTASNSSRLTSYFPTSSSTPLTFELEVLQGMDPKTNSPQLGYPGLTLATPFNVILQDQGKKTLYNRIVIAGATTCATPATEVLKVTWSSPNGLIATTAVPGATAVGGLPFPIGTPVFFTPQGPGPWYLTASVGGDVQDPTPNQFNWVDPTGTAHCYQANALSLYVLRAFIIQLPQMELQDSATGTALTSVAAGTTVQMVATTSPYVAGKPDDLALRGMCRDGTDVATYNGLPAPFKQPNIPMTAGTSPQVKSQPVVILRGDPVLPSTPTWALSILPSSWMEWSCAGLTLWAPTTPVARTRRLINGTASIQDAIPGTSPHDGFDDSVQLCSGEVVRSVADLTFLTRGGEIAVVRTYRDHLGGAGIMGPGWVSPFEANFDTAWPWGLRFQDGYGRLFEFVQQTIPTGLYCVLNLNSAIDVDHGAYELVDRHGAKTHFNVDGSLRHIEDLNKNRTKFHYNTKGQLFEIVDPFGRTTQLNYYPDTTTPKELRGLLQQVIDFDERPVDYTYYPGNTADGYTGYLQTVQRPPAPTMIKGAEVPNYRRSETYTYTIMAGDPRDGALRDVIDSEQVTQATTVYTPLRQAYTQTYGGATLTLGYDSTKNETTVSDRAGNVRVWTFAVSPFSDAATPTDVTELPNGVRPGGQATTTKMKHSRFGEMTSCQYPDGKVRTYVYDDASVYQQSLGNMLMCQETNAKGATRTTTFVYDQRFNLVFSQNYWDGYALGIPSYLRTHYIYDAQGNLTDISGPRTLFGVLIKNTSGGDEVQWVHDQHRYHMEYNNLGLVTSIQYPNGVVAAFEYYPDSTPGGALGMATDPNNGGFLGKITRDASDNSTRDIYFPTLKPMSIKTSLTFDDRGDLQTFTGPNGLRSRLECNALRQVIRAVECDNLPAGQTPVVHHYRYFSSGMLARTELEQPNALPVAGGTLLASDATLNADGLPVQTRSDWVAAYTSSTGTPVPAQSLYTKSDANHEGLVEAVYAPSTGMPTITASQVNHDERGLPFQQTLSPGQDPLTFQFDFGVSGSPGGITEPGGLTLAAGYDDFGGVSSLTDNASAQMAVLPDFSGRGARLSFNGLNGGKNSLVLGFQEQHFNELGELRRIHDALMAVDVQPVGGVTYPITDASEAYPKPATGTWPPVSSSTLNDQGQWCRGDERSSMEALFDPWGNMARFVNDENRALFVAYNPLGGVARALDNGSYEIRHIVDPTGVVSEVEVDEYSTDTARPNGRTLRWRTRRDSHGRVQEIADALGNTLRAEYDDDSQIIAVTDSIGPDSPNLADNYNGHAINQAGNRTHYPHDGLGWIRGFTVDLTQGGIGGQPPEVNTWNGDAKVARAYDYDEWGHIRTITDHVGKVTTWKYENAGGGRCTSLVRPASQAAATPTTSFTYDPQGRLETSTDPNGTRLHYYYDQRNRLQKMVTEAVGAGVHSGVGDGVQFTYNDFDRLQTATPFVSTGLPQSALEMHWGFQGTLLEEQQQGLWITRQCEGTRQRKSLTYPGNGPKVTATYDTNNRLRVLTMTPPATGAAAPTATILAQYEYLGPTTVLNRTTGPVVVQYDFDDAGRTNHMWLDSGAFRYDLDLRRDGRVKTATRTATIPPATAGAAPTKIAESRTWTYDSACRVVGEQASFAAVRTPQQVVTTRAFDGEGGAWDVTFASTAAGVTTNTALAQKFEARGRLLTSNTNTYRYDANGNLISDGKQIYFYDFLDRLVEVKDLTTATETHYTYDALGRCTARGRGTVETYFYDGWHLIEVRVNNQVTERYYWGRGHDEMVRAEINQKVRYLVTAPNGNVDSLLDDQGNIIESYDYSLNGEVTVLDANRKPLTTPPQSRFGFHGLMYDPATGLLDARYRQYHVGMGQFLSADPHGITGIGNEYVWAHQDPINLTERYGLQDDAIDWGDAAWSFCSTLGVGLIFVGGAALLLGAGLVSAPILVIGGLAILGASIFASAWMRQMDDQSIPEALIGGLLDTFGLTNAWTGATGDDLITGAHYQLTGSQRGKLLGGGLGTMGTFLFGGKVFKSLATRANGWELPVRLQRYSYRYEPVPTTYPRTAIRLRAARNGTYNIPLPRAVSGLTGEDLGAQQSVGRAKTLADFVDIIQARLRSKPGPRARFRECAITRATTVNDAGDPLGSDLVYQTPALLEGEIPEYEDNLPIDQIEELAARFPRLRVNGRMHTHPPSFMGRHSYSLPGHSMGDINVLSSRFGGNSPLGLRTARGFQPFVARIGANGAPEEVAYIMMRADAPAAPPCTAYPPPSPPVPGRMPGATSGAAVQGLINFLRRRRRR